MNFKNILTDPIFKLLEESVNEIGLKSYIVGGFVRDLLIKKLDIKDIDIVVVGSGIELAKKVKNKLNKSSKIQIYKSYGTAMLKSKNLTLEFVGSRKESYSMKSRNPEISFGTLNEDLERRDFTINSMAISLNRENYGVLIDPFKGIVDLKNQIIKTPLDPIKTFSDDPLRMLRAIRFCSQLNFKIEPNSLRAITQNSERISIITNERIVIELNKILESKKPSKGFIILDETGLLEKIIPELNQLKGVEEIEGKTHKENFFHTLEVVDNISKQTNNLWLRWAALLHDIGKPLTKKFNKKVGWTFHGHESVGAKMVYKIFKRLKMPLNEKMKYVQRLVFMSSRPIILSENEVTDAAVRRLVFDSGELLEDLICLCEADITTKNPKRFHQYHENFKIIREKIRTVEERDRVRNFQPPISGKKIMNYFGLKPCKKVGIIKETIKEAILEGEISNKYLDAFNLMKKKGSEMGLKPNENKL